MSRIAVWLSRAAPVAAVFALAAVTLAMQPVSAQALADTPTPPAPAGTRLQLAWGREQQAYARLGNFFGRVDEHIAKAQALIDQAKANGKDVAALQAALDTFSAAVKQARPVYEGAQGIIASHQGFDDSGNVTDFVKAIETVQEMRAKLVEMRQIIRPAAITLRQAVREFRQANRPVPTPTPGGA